MITVNYSHKDAAFCIEAYGHAGTAPKGMDIVCSAVSILAQTAAQCALDLYAKGWLRAFPATVLGSGNCQVAAVAVSEHADEVRQAFETVMTGLYLLQEAYPSCVEIREN